MSDPEYLLVKNWATFQHYKDRNPPWIKLHFEILSSRDWVMLTDTSRVCMVACMLLASRNYGKVVNDTEYIGRVCHIKHVDLNPLIQIGFLVHPDNGQGDASGCKHLRTNADPETEKRREETETEKTPLTPQMGGVCEITPFDLFWEACPKKTGKGAAQKSWTKLRPSKELTAAIMASVERHKGCRKWQEERGRFIPNPATWLNQRRWEDEPDSTIPEKHKATLGSGNPVADLNRRVEQLRKQFPNKTPAEISAMLDAEDAQRGRAHGAKNRTGGEPVAISGLIRAIAGTKTITDDIDAN